MQGMAPVAVPMAQAVAPVTFAQGGRFGVHVPMTFRFGASGSTQHLPPAHDQALRELAQHCQRACKMQHYTPKLLYLIVIGCIVAIVAQLFPILFESGEDMGSSIGSSYFIFFVLIGLIFVAPRILRAKMLAAQRERDQALRTAVTSLNSDPRFAGWTWTVMPNELGVLRICGLITLTFPRVSLGPAAAAAAGGAGGAAVAPGTLPMAVPVNNISAYPGGVAMQQLQQQQQQQQQQQPGFAVPQAYPAASVVGYAAGPAPGVGVGGGVGGGMPAAYSGAGGAPPSYSYTSSTATATGAVGYAPAQPGTAAAPPVTSEPPASATAPIGYSPGGVGVGYNPTAPAVAATPGYNPTPYNAGGASDLPPASNNGKPSAGGPGVLL